MPLSHDLRFQPFNLCDEIWFHFRKYKMLKASSQTFSNLGGSHQLKSNPRSLIFKTIPINKSRWLSSVHTQTKTEGQLGGADS